MIVTTLLSILLSLQPAVPDTLTLEYCYSRIENHYPLSQKIELQQDITDLNKKIANTASYPQLNFGAQATYQSEVTELQFPAGGEFTGPKLSKDQYKATGDISQNIFNGGRVEIQKDLVEVQGRQQQQSTKIELRQITEQVNQAFFGILLAQQQVQVVSTLTKNLKSQISDVESKVRNGALLPSQQYILEAELVKARQDSVDIASNIRSGYRVLSQLIGQEVTSKTTLKDPNVEPILTDSLPHYRPEFDLFESHRRALDHQKELAQTNIWPSLSAFGTVAYGRPGFNVFDDNLHGYYIVGLRLKWNFWNARNSGFQRQIYNLQEKSVIEEERAFERQLRSRLSKIHEQINSLENQLQRDREIIDLRKKVVAEKSSQMKNGAATATEYITELTKATQAELSMMMRQIKLKQAKTEYQLTLGNL